MISARLLKASLIRGKIYHYARSQPERLDVPTLENGKPKGTWFPAVVSGLLTSGV